MISYEKIFKIVAQKLAYDTNNLGTKFNFLSNYSQTSGGFLLNLSFDMMIIKYPCIG